MRRLVLCWALVLAALWVACDDDDGDNGLIVPNGNGTTVDLSTFEGCWHVRSGITMLGQEGTPCRAALDSITDLFLEVAAFESVFVRIDTVTDLVFVDPYRGAGDFSGTDIPGRNGTVNAVYRHPATDACTLVTTFSGSIQARGDTALDAPYIVDVQFDGDTTCSSLGSCSALVLFQATRRAEVTCNP
jgi:hypothetical protein